MGKIILIIVIVGVVVAVLSGIFGGENPIGDGCMASAGCGYTIVQILITVAVLALCIMFVTWLFD